MEVGPFLLPFFCCMSSKYTISHVLQAQAMAPGTIRWVWALAYPVPGSRIRGSGDPLIRQACHIILIPRKTRYCNSLFLLASRILPLPHETFVRLFLSQSLCRGTLTCWYCHSL